MSPGARLQRHAKPCETNALLPRIALALKLKAIEHCRSKDVPLVKTWNASTNTGMLGINEALGFVRQPAWINYALEIQNGSG